MKLHSPRTKGIAANRCGLRDIRPLPLAELLSGQLTIFGSKQGEVDRIALVAAT